MRYKIKPEPVNRFRLNRRCRRAFSPAGVQGAEFLGKICNKKLAVFTAEIFAVAGIDFNFIADINKYGHLNE